MKKLLYFILSFLILGSLAYGAFIFFSSEESSSVENINLPNTNQISTVSSDSPVEAAEETLTEETPTEETPLEAVEETLAEETPAEEAPLEAVVETLAVKLDQPILIYLGSFLLLTVCALFIVTLLLFKEVRWRKRHSNSESLVFPDAHLDTLEDLKKWFKELANLVVGFGNTTETNQKQNESLAGQTIDSISKFNTLIDDQQKEIGRLKEGYDFSAKKQSIKALIGVKDLLNQFLKDQLSEETIETLNKVNAYIESYLEELDVEGFSFKSGQSVRELSGDEFEISDIELTTEETLHEKIMETLVQGYVFVHPNGKTIIRKAKLKVYKKE